MPVLARPAAALAFALTVAPVIFTQPPSWPRRHHRRADGDAVSDRSGRRADWRTHRVGEQQRRAQRPGRRRRPITSGAPVTSYTGDDGLWITELGWTSDAKTLVYVRGDGANRQGESPNPAQLQDGTEQAVFAVAVDGGAPKRLGAGNGPVPSPRGQRVAWVSRGQIWSVDLATADKPAQLVNARGSASGLAWSPDGSMLAFASGRGTTATSAFSRWRRASCATSIRRSIATATRCGRLTDRTSPGCARPRHRGRDVLASPGRSTNRGRCASPT